MALTRFAMIIKGPGYNPAVHRVSLTSPEFTTIVVCVSSFEQALPVANELLQQGVQLIELCGGFTPDQASTLRASIGQRVPVGVVRYSVAEQQHLAVLLDNPSSET
ncbi:MAG: hypothetical protein HY696_00360 [Deltaproteobacteria bacterium]|nr:hypothetical protein [Deltaproteobacteria bacterium]